MFLWVTVWKYSNVCIVGVFVNTSTFHCIDTGMYSTSCYTFNIQVCMYVPTQLYVVTRLMYSYVVESLRRAK